MTSQRFLASVLLLGAGVSAQPQGNNQFKVVDQATITCSTAGFKCGYNDFDYETVDITGSGQSSIGGLDDNNNMIWSPLDVATDQLILSNCQSDNCLLVCNVGCDCVDETGAACAAGTFAPTAAPTADTGSRTCPRILNTEYCEELNAVLPPGNLDNFDCFNFCGGAAVGTCSFEGVCGELTCSNATDGGPLGLVQGCTKALLQGADQGSGAISTLTRWYTSALAASALLLAVYL